MGSVRMNSGMVTKLAISIATNAQLVPLLTSKNLEADVANLEDTPETLGGEFIEACDDFYGKLIASKEVKGVDTAKMSEGDFKGSYLMCSMPSKLFQCFDQLKGGLASSTPLW